MTNYEYIQAKPDIEMLGRYLCNATESLYGEDKWACDFCPVSEKCWENHNGWIAWLEEEKGGTTNT